jgi:hypothetical protein
MSSIIMMVKNNLLGFWTKVKVIKHLVEVLFSIAFDFYNIKLILSYSGDRYKFLVTKWFIWWYYQYFYAFSLQMMECSYQRQVIIAVKWILCDRVKFVKNYCDSFLRLNCFVNLFCFLSAKEALLIRILNYFVNLFYCWIVVKRINHITSFYFLFLIIAYL